MVDSDDVVRNIALWAANRKRRPEKGASDSSKEPYSQKKPKPDETNKASSDKLPVIDDLHAQFSDIKDDTHSKQKGLPTTYFSSEVTSILPSSWNNFLSILKDNHPSSDTSNAFELLGQSFSQFCKQFNEKDRSFELIKADRDTHLRLVESLKKDLAALDQKFLDTKVSLETNELKVIQLEESIKSLSRDLEDSKKKVEHLEELLKSKDLVIGDRDKTISDHICALERMQEEKAIFEEESVQLVNQGFLQFHFALTHRFPDLKEKANIIKLNTACGHFTRHLTHEAEFDHDQEFLYPPFDLKTLEALKVDISSLRIEDVEYSRKLDADTENTTQAEQEPNQDPSSGEVPHSSDNPDHSSEISASRRNQEKEDEGKNITANEEVVGDSKNEENQNAQSALSSVLRPEPATSNIEDKRLTLSGNPFFTSIVVKSHLQSPFQLVVPASFRQFLSDVSAPVVLSCQNRSWKMRYCARSLKKIIRCGWKQFAIDNDLKIGDACVFELMNREELEFRVQILRADILAKFTDGKSDSKTEENKYGESAHGSVQTSDPATPDLQDKVVPLSGNPNFTSIVLKYQLQNPFQLVVPASFHQFLPDVSAPVVFSCQNRSWKMRYSGQPKRVIRCGWKRFAMDNDLKVGDDCVYELTNREELMFRVHILRANTLSMFADCTSDSKTEENKNGRSALGSVQTSDPATSDVQDKVVPLSGNPIFTSVVAKYQLLKPFQLVVPKSFHQFLPDVSLPVILSYQNRSWKMRYWGQFVMRTICLGWEKFAIDNNLKVGDRCIYELVNRKKLEFRVQILRANDTAGQGSDCPVMIDED